MPHYQHSILEQHVLKAIYMLVSPMYTHNLTGHRFFLCVTGWWCYYSENSSSSCMLLTSCLTGVLWTLCVLSYGSCGISTCLEILLYLFIYWMCFFSEIIFNDATEKNKSSTISCIIKEVRCKDHFMHMNWIFWYVISIWCLVNEYACFEALGWCFSSIGCQP